MHSSNCEKWNHCSINLQYQINPIQLIFVVRHENSNYINFNEKFNEITSWYEIVHWNLSQSSITSQMSFTPNSSNFAKNFRGTRGATSFPKKPQPTFLQTIVPEIPWTDCEESCGEKIPNLGIRGFKCEIAKNWMKCVKTNIPGS